MNPTLQNVAAAAIAPKLIRTIRFSWVLYGVAAYYGLKELKKRNIFPDQTGAILEVVDQGLEKLKQQVGLSNA